MKEFNNPTEVKEMKGGSEMVQQNEGSEKARKSLIYWLGLIIFAGASVGLFGILWMCVMLGSMYLFRSPLVPAIIGGVVFAYIGLRMMQSESSSR